MKVAIIVQRYGEEVIGGAESLARQTVEKMAEMLGWRIEVFTTTALESQSWESYFPEGVTAGQGITVRRFRPRRTRSFACRVFNRLFWALHPFLSLSIPGIRQIYGLLEKAWFRYQGPFVPELLVELERDAHDFDRIIFFTYLYYPSIEGIPRLAKRCYLVPTAHDEPAFYLKSTERMLRSCKGLIANGAPEKRFIEEAYPNLDVPIVIGGTGIECPDFGEVVAVPSEPYLVYLGRLNRGKGVSNLIAWFKSAKTILGIPKLRLYLAGRKESNCPIVEDDDIYYCGVVSESEKWLLYQGAVGIVNPSPLESLSLLVLEGIMMGKPVLLNRECHVFRYYAELMDTCFLFSDRESFKKQLSFILHVDWKSGDSQERLAKSRHWVGDNYSWKRVTDVYRSLN